VVPLPRTAIRTRAPLGELNNAQLPNLMGRISIAGQLLELYVRNSFLPVEFRSRPWLANISGVARIFTWGMPNQNFHMRTGKIHLATVKFHKIAL